MCYVSIQDINFWTNGIKREQRLSRSLEIVRLLTCWLVVLCICLAAWLIGIVSFNGCFVLVCLCTIVVLFVLYLCLCERLALGVSVYVHELRRFS